MFSRTLNCEIALRALVITGFWPAISARSAAATDAFFESAVDSPTPMLSVIFSILGTCIGFV